MKFVLFLTVFYSYFIIELVRAQGTVSTLAGQCGQSAAGFFLPTGILASSSNDAVYIVDSGFNRIRKVTLAGAVSTLITGLNQPRALAWDPSNGDLIISDSGNYCIKRTNIISPSLVHVAGMCGSSGYANGPVSSSLFSDPKGITFDSNRNLIVADLNNNCIRKVANGLVSTLAGSCGDIYKGFADATGAAARFYNPYDVTADGGGNVYVSDSANACIRKITSGGVVTTYSGPCGAGNPNLGDLASIVYYNSVIYVSVFTRHCVRAVYPEGGAVSTVVGTCDSLGCADGAALSSKFNFPHGLAPLPNGDVIIAEQGNYCIRRLSRCSGTQMFDYVNQVCVSPTCNAGFELINGACQACQSAFYKASSGNGQCSACALNTQSNSGKTGCDPCPAGTYRSSSQLTCQTLPPNSQLSPTGALTCNQGYVINSAGTGCNQCQVGTESNPDKTVCVNCLTNAYRPALVYPSCIACPTLFTCTNTQSQCIAGYTLSSPGSNTCNPCASGYFKLSPGNGTCTQCPIGQESSGDKSACVNCPTGKYRPSLSDPTCIMCPSNAKCDLTTFQCLAGLYRDPISNSCKPCDEGYFKSLDGNQACSPCNVGSESSFDRKSCQTCVSGKYRPALSYQKCIACPGNSTCTSTTFQCIAGYFLSNGQCIQCPEGYSKNTDGNQTCTQCNVGSESSLDRKSCQTCLTGKYRPALSFSKCIACPGNATCTSTTFQCIAGYFLNNDKCIQCTEGYAKDVDGNQTCAQCSLGTESDGQRKTCVSCVSGKTYRSLLTQPTCQSCPENSTCHASNFTCNDGYKMNSVKTGCDQCPIGTESSADNLNCVSCANEKYRPHLYLNSCTTCPNNSICNTTSFSCASGYFWQTSTASCVKCLPGYFKSVAGNQTCSQCSAGQESYEDRTRCQDCLPDRYKSLQSQTCISCPINAQCNGANFTCNSSFIVNSTFNGCESCPEGTESDDSREKCVSCARGTYRPSLSYESCIECPGNATCTTSSFKCNAGFYLEIGSKSCLVCPLGTVKSFLGNDSCTSCEVGYESDPSRLQCVSCIDGVTFRSASQQICTLCPNLSVCNTTGFSCYDGYRMDLLNSKCEPCPIGFESSENRTACVQCDSGSYRMFQNQTVCTKCPEHSTCHPTEFLCEAGYRFNPDVLNCTQCQTGFYKSFSGNGDCLKCDSGLESNIERTGCAQCGQNYYRPGNVDICVPCPSHATCNSTDFMCEIGYETKAVDGTSCTECPAGKYRSSSVQNACISCPDNATCDTKGFVCKIGFEADGQSCKPCRSRTYRSSVSWPACVDCPRNSTCNSTQFVCDDAFKINAQGDGCYQIVFTTSSSSTRLPTSSSATHTSISYELTQSSRTSGSSNLIDSITSSSSSSAISKSSELSPTGIVCPENAVCDGEFSQCRAGYSMNPISNNCTTCDFGYAKTGIGNEPCTICPAGTEPNILRDQCKPCSQKKFKPTGDMMFCIDCPRNSLCDIKNFICTEGFVLNAAGNGCDTMSSMRSQEVGQWTVFEIVIVVVFLILTILILLYQCVYMRKAKVSRNFIKAATMDTNASTVTAGSSLNLLGSDTSLFSDALVKKQAGGFGLNASPTLFEDENGLSDVPVHMKFEFGKDFELDGFLDANQSQDQQKDPHFLGLAKHRGLAIFGSQIVVKTVSVIDNTVEATAFFSEVKISCRLRENFNIAKFLGYSQNPHWCVLNKYYALGSLDDWMKSSHSGRSKSNLLSFLLDISRGLKAVHSLTFAHCNLKPSNILVDRDLNDRLFCVVSDFKYTRPRMGIPASRYRPLYISRASCAYAAPEVLVLDSRPHGRVINYQLADVYSLSLLTYELIRLKKPWAERIIEI